MIKVFISILFSFLMIPLSIKAEVSVEQMVGSMIMCGFQGKTAPPEILSAIKQGHLGGVILYNGDNLYNVDSPHQLKLLTTSLQTASPIPILIGIDQEGGIATRLKNSAGFKEFPSVKSMGESSSTEQVYDIALTSGKQLHELGININFAPVVDIDAHNNSLICGQGKERCFSGDPHKVSALALAFGKGMINSGVLPTLKHFPGLGSAVMDSHLVLPDISDTWTKKELFPYKEAIRKGWQGLIMVNHSYNRNIDSNNISSLSPNYIQRILRQKLGWHGAVISDDLQMKGVSQGLSLDQVIKKAIIAGNDILLFSNNLDYKPQIHEEVFQIIMTLIDKGEITKDRIKQSWIRIEVLKKSIQSGSF